MISVIIPAYNSEYYIRETVRTVLKTLKDMPRPFEIIVVDDCSEDDTVLALMEIYDKHLKDDVRIFTKFTNQGKGAAIRTGYKMAKGDHIAIMDADLQVKPDEIKTFFRIMNLYNADAVIGNKRHSFSNVRLPLKRWIISRGYGLMVKMLFGFPIRDTQCGFKLFKRKALELIMDKIYVKRYAFDIEMLVALRDSNCRIADAPVLMTKPIGPGSVSAVSIMNTAKDTLAVAWRRWHGSYNNKKRG